MVWQINQQGKHDRSLDAYIPLFAGVVSTPTIGLIQKRRIEIDVCHGHENDHPLGMGKRHDCYLSLCTSKAAVASANTVHTVDVNIVMNLYIWNDFETRV